MLIFTIIILIFFVQTYTGNSFLFSRGSHGYGYLKKIERNIQRIATMKMLVDEDSSSTSTTGTLLSISKPEVDKKEELETPIIALSGKSPKRVTWSAGAESSVRVKEVNRTVEEYMALPASEYSVLSAEQVVRLNDKQFKCILGDLNFLGTIICPVLFVDVNVIPDESRSEINVLRAETIGSPTAESVSCRL